MIEHYIKETANSFPILKISIAIYRLKQIQMLGI